MKFFKEWYSQSYSSFRYAKNLHTLEIKFTQYELHKLRLEISTSLEKVEKVRETSYNRLVCDNALFLPNACIAKYINSFERVCILYWARCFIFYEISLFWRCQYAFNSFALSESKAYNVS